MEFASEIKFLNASPFLPDELIKIAIDSRKKADILQPIFNKIMKGLLTMYAIFETGGKQYRVCKGDVLDVERLSDVEESKINFDSVLAIGNDGDMEVGTPTIEGAVVTADLVKDFRGKKITVFKMKRRKGYRKKQGHRQELSRIMIQDIKKP